MFNKLSTKSIMLAALLAVSGSTFASSTTLAGWQFTTTVAAADNTPAATSGLYGSSASLTQLGMTNSYNGGNTASCDVTSTTGDPNTAASGFAWRVRGTANNGWALAAPQYSQGAQLNVSTVGYSNISFSFDWFCTTQGIADLMVQYTTDGTNWTNYSGSVAGVTTQSTGNGTLLIATPNSYNTVSTSVVTNTINLSGISGVSNDANFGIRLVSAYDPTAGTYLGASGGTYNNTSGNWRFDQLFVTGTAAPELPTGVVLAVAGLGLVILKARRS